MIGESSSARVPIHKYYAIRIEQISISDKKIIFKRVHNRNIVCVIRHVAKCCKL